MNNRDDHSKNLTFMLNAQDEWVLAPPYDLTYAEGSGGEHVLKVAKAGGLKDADAGNVIDEMLSTLTTVALRQEAANLPVPEHKIDAVAKVIEANRQRLVK